MIRRALAGVALALSAGAAFAAEAAVEYTLTFPEAEQRWMQVEVRFADLDRAPLEVRMSRSSPGRYALHEFVKNVYAVEATDGAGRELKPQRADRYGWTVAGHDGAVTFRYRIYGDRVDGTYLGIDATHAHVNAPAAFVWARGLEHRPATVRIQPPPASGWRVATQLRPGDDPLSWTAPNLAYLLDSPIEASDHRTASFDLAARADGGGPARTLRIALHHQGSAEDLAAMLEATELIAREQRAVFGELPEFDGVGYTFLADYLPWASGDGMEHRNSTVLTSSLALAEPDERLRLLRTVSHELFHAWNVERVRPASLEPFDFEEANFSGELWLAEGFTTYYGSLTLHRAGLADLSHTLSRFGQQLDTVINGPGRRLRSAVEMSRLAPYVDAATSVDRTNWGNTFISYYTWGSALALGLDLSLRDRTDGRVSLDELMRALWERFGKLPPPAPGRVARPYTVADVEATLADVSGDPGFARDFLERYVRGREVPDYAALLDRAGVVLQPRYPENAWLGGLDLAFEGETARVTGPVAAATPAHAAGLAQDDVLVTLDGEAPRSGGALARQLRRHAPGDVLALRFLRRGALVESQIRLGADPAVELVAAEEVGQELDAGRRTFRDAWLGSRAGDGATAINMEARP